MQKRKENIYALYTYSVHADQIKYVPKERYFEMRWHDTAKQAPWSTRECKRKKTKTCALSRRLLFMVTIIYWDIVRSVASVSRSAYTHAHMQFLAPWASIFGLMFSVIVHFGFDP